MGIINQEKIFRNIQNLNRTLQPGPGVGWKISAQELGKLRRENEALRSSWNQGPDVGPFEKMQ